jgi:glutathione S-transferase
LRYDSGRAFGTKRTSDDPQMNPNRLVPTIRDDDLVTREWNTYPHHLTVRHGDGGLYPFDLKRAVPGRSQAGISAPCAHNALSFQTKSLAPDSFRTGTDLALSATDALRRSEIELFDFLMRKMTPEPE